MISFETYLDYALLGVGLSEEKTKVLELSKRVNVQVVKF